MTFQSALELVPMFSETFPANHFVTLSDCIHIHSTVRLPLIGYIFVRLANLASHLTHKNWLMILLLFLMSGRDDISRLHIFVQKGAGRGGGGCTD